jgi:hypothetical protein
MVAATTSTRKVTISPLRPGLETALRWYSGAGCARYDMVDL